MQKQLEKTNEMFAAGYETLKAFTKIQTRAWDSLADHQLNTFRLCVDYTERQLATLTNGLDPREMLEHQSGNTQEFASKLMGQVHILFEATADNARETTAWVSRCLSPERAVAPSGGSDRASLAESSSLQSSKVHKSAA